MANSERADNDLQKKLNRKLPTEQHGPIRKLMMLAGAIDD